MAIPFQHGNTKVTWSQKVPSPEPTDGMPSRARNRGGELFKQEAVKDAFPRRVARGPLLQWQIDPRSGAKIAFELYADGHRVKIPASEWGAAAWFKRRWGSFNES